MKKIAAFLLTLLLLSSPVSAQSKTDWNMGAAYVSLAAVTVADIDTTRAVLERGGAEANPILKPFTAPGTLGLVNGAMSGGIALASHHFLFKKGKTRQAKFVIWTWTAIRALVVVHNLRELKK